MIDSDTRLRAARGIAKTETEASREVFATLKRRGHPEALAPTLSDCWGGIDEAMVAGYGMVPEYTGAGRPPTKKGPQPGWQYLQLVKQPKKGRQIGTKFRVIFGNEAEVVKLMGKSTAYIERSHLTSRHFNGRQVRKTRAFSKSVVMYRASAALEDAYYNLVRPHKSLRVEVKNDPTRRWRPRTPAMTAELTDHIWTVKELFWTLPILINT